MRIEEPPTSAGAGVPVRGKSSPRFGVDRLLGV